MAMGAVERDVEEDSGVMLWTGTGRTSQAWRTAWENEKGECLEMYFLGMFGGEIMGQMMGGGILTPNER